MEPVKMIVHNILSNTCLLLIIFICLTQMSITIIATTPSLISASEIFNPIELLQRERRQLNAGNARQIEDNNKSNSSFQSDDVGWSEINEEVDMVVPRVVDHLQKLGIQWLELTNLNESISVMPLIIRYEVGVYLKNGIAYNLAGIKRYGDAFMTYSIDEKSFVSRFNLIITSLQFEYDFFIKLTPFEGYGKVIGYLDDVIAHAELGVNVIDLHFKLYDFRILRFRNIHVEIDQMRIIRQLSGAILSPITNLFRDRITTSISEGLKEQMQLFMDDFNDNDPLELRKFATKLISSLTNTGSNITIT